MMKRLSRWWSSAGPSIALTTVMVVARFASAQDGAPPQPSLTRSQPPWVGYIIMFVLLALVLGVSLLPAKRGHQD